MEVRVGSFVNGQPRLQIYNWSSCKIANLRSDTKEAERPNLGRRRGQGLTNEEEISSPVEVTEKPEAESIEDQNTLSHQPHPNYIKKGPIITDKMFDEANWPKILQIPTKDRPTRSTRNPRPAYVDAIAEVNEHRAVPGELIQARAG